MFQIIADSSCDLGRELLERWKIHVVPYYISVEEGEYKKEIEEMGVREFYEFMDANPKVFPKTSLPSVADYGRAMYEYVEKGIDVICVCLTSKFSGSYNSAVNARELLLEQYPQAKIAVVDSTVATVLEGLVVLEAAKMRDAGYSFERTVEVLEQVKATGRIFFTIGSLDYLVHGGRIGRLTGLAAGTLGLKPLITLHNGELYPEGVVHGRVKSRRRVIEKALEYMEQEKMNPDDYEIVTGYGLDYAEAEKFRDLLEEELHKKYGRPLGPVGIYQIGATIGVYTGPHPVGLGFIRHYDTF